MNPSQRKKLVIGLWIGAGLVAAGAGVYGLKKRGILGQFGLGRTLSPPPPLVSTNRIGDAEVRLYRANNIPIDQRVRLIQDRVWKGVNDPRVRKLAGEITQGCGRNDGTCEAQKIFAAVVKRVRYTGDVAPVRHPDGTVEAIDYFQGPYRTWEYRIGDCDDMAGLTAALLSVIGVPAQLRVTAPSRLGEWAHIYVAASLPKTNPRKQVVLDTTLPGPRFGREVPYGRKRDYPV